MISKKKKVKFTILLIAIAAVLFSIYYFDVIQLLTPEMIKSNVESFGVFAPIVFILLYIVATVFFLPGTPLSIASGVLFGPIFGTIYVVVGATVGASIAFFVARYFGEGFVDSFLKDKFKTLHEYDHKLEKNGFVVVLLLRFIPLFPFNGLNFAFGLTEVRFKHFFLATLFGIIPGTFVYAYLGSSLSSFNVYNIIIALVLLALFIIVPHKIHKHQKKKRGLPHEKEV
ncbi:TVP38/TMEM64 family protein [archaeon]|nr:TVP38/TMEM64 family protein [archaeon]|tara:strand:+ start:2001 stop:2684 length:684 start_codon:yes stop_codon:yes gene_type:complete